MGSIFCACSMGLPVKAKNIVLLLFIDSNQRVVMGRKHLSSHRTLFAVPFLFSPYVQAGRFDSFRISSLCCRCRRELLAKCLSNSPQDLVSVQARWLAVRRLLPCRLSTLDAFLRGRFSNAL